MAIWSCVQFVITMRAALIVPYFVNNLFDDDSLASAIVKILTILLITGTVIYSLTGPPLLFIKIKVLF